MASLLYPDDDPAAGPDGMAEVYRAITDSMERQRQQAQPTVADLGLFGPVFKYADNPVGTETTQSMGMPQPTTYAGLVGQFIDPNTGQLTEQGQARMDNPLLGFDTGGIGGVVKGFHGSPHAFDRFDNAAIGTGEGAQAYGYGHYLADSEGVARSYRDAVTKQKTNDPAMWQGIELPPSLTKEQLDQYATLTQQMRRTGNLPPSDMATWRELSGIQRTYDDAVQAAKPTGHMYEVAVNAEPEHFLDWDKPLSEQHPVVRQALASIKPGDVGLTPVQTANGIRHVTSQGFEVGPRIYDKAPGDISLLDIAGDRGMSAVENLANWTGGHANASELLQKAGIPGIRYLDAGSRGAGEGSRNSVVFNPANMEIIRKYGLAWLLGGGAAGAAATQGTPQQ